MKSLQKFPSYAVFVKVAELCGVSINIIGGSWAVIWMVLFLKKVWFIRTKHLGIWIVKICVDESKIL